MVFYFWAVILDILCWIFLHSPWLLDFATYAKNYRNHSIDVCCEQNHYQYFPSNLTFLRLNCSEMDHRSVSHAVDVTKAALRWNAPMLPQKLEDHYEANSWLSREPLSWPRPLSGISAAMNHGEQSAIEVTEVILVIWGDYFFWPNMADWLTEPHSLMVANMWTKWWLDLNVVALRHLCVMMLALNLCLSIRVML